MTYGHQPPISKPTTAASSALLESILILHQLLQSFRNCWFYCVTALQEEQLPQQSREQQHLQQEHYHHRHQYRKRWQQRQSVRVSIETLKNG